MISKKLWERLTPIDQTRFEYVLHHLKLIADLRRAASHPALSFAIRAGLMTFALLYVLPLHPMSMPIALGGGVAIILIAKNVELILFKQKSPA